jgi:hypothetical protein
MVPPTPSPQSSGCTRRSFCRLRGSATTTSLCKTTKLCFRTRSTAIALSRARMPFRVPIHRIVPHLPATTARGQSSTTVRTTRRATSLYPNACPQTRTVIATCARPMAARNRVPTIAPASSVRLPATARQTTTLCVVKQPPMKKTAKCHFAHGTKTATSAPTRQVNVRNKREGNGYMVHFKQDDVGNAVYLIVYTTHG